MVLLDPSVLSEPERLHGLLPDAVFVGGQITATNNLHAVEGEARPEVVKSGLIPPSTVQVGDSSGAMRLSDATYMPGRGGRLWAAADSLSELQYCIPSENIMRLPQGLKCACILRGKHCSTSKRSDHL